MLSVSEHSQLGYEGQTGPDFRGVLCGAAQKGLQLGIPVCGTASEVQALPYKPPEYSRCCRSLQGGVLISFRLLVPLEHAGRVIGRSGEVIKQIRQQTNARVKMHEPTDGEAHRAVQGRTIKQTRQRTDAPVPMHERTGGRDARW